MGVKWLWHAMFIAGSAMAWGAYLAPFARGKPHPVRALIARFRTEGGRNRSNEFWLPVQSDRERAFLERARLSGLRWTYRQYLVYRIGGSAAGVYVSLAAAISHMSGIGGISPVLVLRSAVIACLAGSMLWFVPEWIMTASAAKRRAGCLMEISKFAHRLSICVTENADIREMILRAGRPMRLLRPHVQQLALHWGKNQREAIMAFKDGVGISEVYPLVNAFMAISAARSTDVSKLLVEHSKSIDATLEAEIAKRIENAPVWISFYIMIPFFICLLLFVYPWVLTVLEQLSVGFSAG